MNKLVGVPVLIAAAVLWGVACSSGGGAHDVGSATTPTSAATTSSTVAATNRPLSQCPSSLPSSVDNTGVPGLGAKMVPIVATAARVCRYAPLNAKNANALVRSGVVTGSAAVRQLENQTNALHHIPNAERIPCPLIPTAPGWSLEFRDGASALTLVVSASDCGFVTNGVISAGPTTAWLDALATITEPR
jgi:hypothetical protein